jgi:CBS domain-containing protein
MSASETEAVLPEMAHTKVGEIEVREPVRMAPDAPMVEAVTLLRERNRGAVIIEGAGGELLGIFTEHDLVSRVDHMSHDWHDDPVRDHMTERPITVKASQPLARAIVAMEAGGFRNLPIVDDAGKVTGLISIRDVLRHIAERYPQEFLNLPPDPDREAKNPWGG